MTNSINEQAVDQDVQDFSAKPNECPGEDLNSQRLGELQLKFERANAMKQKILKDYTYEGRKWLTTKYFDENVINDIKTYQSDLIRVEDVELNKHWFHYIKNELEPELSR